MCMKTYFNLMIFSGICILLIAVGCGANKQNLKMAENQKEQLQQSQNKVRELEAQIKDIQSRLDKNQSSIDQLKNEKQEISNTIEIVACQTWQ